MVRILSAVCLGVGTMIGYQRIVTTLGQRLGKIHLTSAQGAAAETYPPYLSASQASAGFRANEELVIAGAVPPRNTFAWSGLVWRVRPEIHH